MTESKKYIKLLKKLSDGQISDSERWKLEKYALDDAFLADAMEGYYDNEELNNIRKLRDKLNTNKTGKQRSLVVKRMSIAASMIVLLAISFWTMTHFQKQEVELSLSTIEAATQQLDLGEGNQEKSIMENEELDLTKDLEGIEQKVLSISDNNDHIENYKLSAGRSNSDQEKQVEPQVEKSLANSRLNKREKNEAFKKIEQDQIRAISKVTTLKSEKITGKITDHRGVPLSNAMVVSNNGKHRVLTQSDGLFELVLHSEDDTITASANGFVEQKMKAELELDIKLKPVAQALSKQPKLFVELMEDHDLKGYYADQLAEYFRKTSFMPCTRKGSKTSKATLQVTISESNSLEKIKFVEPLDEVCKMAIENHIREAVSAGNFKAGKEVIFEYKLRI